MMYIFFFTWFTSIFLSDNNRTDIFGDGIVFIKCSFSGNACAQFNIVTV